MKKVIIMYSSRISIGCHIILQFRMAKMLFVVAFWDILLLKVFWVLILSRNKWISVNKNAKQSHCVKVENYHKRLVFAFVIYADSETILKNYFDCIANPKNKKHFASINCKHYAACKVDSKDFTVWKILWKYQKNIA